MHFTIYLDLTKLVTFQLTGNFYILFDNITNLNYWYTEEDVTKLEYNINATAQEKYLYVFVDDDTDPTYDFQDNLIPNASQNNEYIVFECDISNSDLPKLLPLLEYGAIKLIEQNQSHIFTFRLNSDKDHLIKSLTFVNVIKGNFKAPISIKNLELDVEGYDINNSYNYVYIYSLNRFYYITNIQLMTKNFTKLILQEDVLMSHKWLIKEQSAFITRYENSTDKSLVDVRLPLEDKLTNVPLTLTDTPSNSLVNCTFKFDITVSDSISNIMIVSFSTTQNIARDSQSYQAPTGLPNQSSQLNTREWVNFIQLNVLKDFVNAYLTDDTVSSFIESVIWLPFNPSDCFDLNHTSGMALYAKDKYIDNTGVYRNDDDHTHTPMMTYQSRLGTNSKHVNGLCPYLIIKDFTYVLPSVNFYDREPYANYEFYIPFVGWIKVESTKFINKRILIYYTMDIKTGISTAYIYNYTDQYVIWSGNCQLGIKLDLTTSNQLENARQKQANDLNMILGLISSAVAIGIGVVSENPIAITGGVLSASKTIASNVNANNQIFERASMSFGSANGSLYSKDSVSIRKTYHEPLSITQSTYKSLEGLPYNKYGSLSSLSGYVEIGDIHFDPKGNNIYNDEMIEIVALLKNGVIL